MESNIDAETLLAIQNFNTISKALFSRVFSQYKQNESVGVVDGSGPGCLLVSESEKGTGGTSGDDSRVPATASKDKYGPADS